MLEGGAILPLQDYCNASWSLEAIQSKILCILFVLQSKGQSYFTCFFWVGPLEKQKHKMQTQQEPKMISTH